jgi:CRISPR-associated protein Csd1
MIISALKGYYERKATNGEIAPEGFEYKELQFLIVINEEGQFINIEDLRERAGNKLAGKTFLLPRSIPRSGSKAHEVTFLLWDHIGYLLGLPVEDKKSVNQNKTWLKMLDNLPGNLSKDIGVKAVKLFYKTGEIKKAIESPQIEECLKSIPCNMAFRLVSDVPVPCREAVREYVSNNNSYNTDEDNTNDDKAEKIGLCIITGENGIIARTHGKTPINKDSKTLVGFQKNSGYDSYGKEQGYNAPISKTTEFAYTTALNTLLKSDKQRIMIGDAVTVFWSEKESSFESDLSMFLAEPDKDNPDSKTERIKSLFESANRGSYKEDDGDTRFFVLGLSPNSARISVRFWQVGTISEFATRIRQHFEDFSIIKPPNEPEYYSIWRILVNIAVQDKSDNITPNLAGDFMRSILEGTPYPVTLIQSAIRRIRSDTEFRVKPIRAALIKAYLNRYYRFYPNNNFKEVEMELDTNQISIGYQLGRLFSVLEKIQEEANPSLNATIRERYYGSACASPVIVFPNLLRLKNHHLAKIENKGRVVNFERILGEIASNLISFPAHLSLHEQGLFAIGYYHQRQNFFLSKKEN